MYIAVHSSGKIQYMPALSVCAGFLAQKGVWKASRQCILKNNAGKERDIQLEDGGHTEHLKMEAKATKTTSM